MHETEAPSLELDQRLVSAFRRAAGIGNLIVVAIAVSVLAGWTLDIPVLRGWAFGRPDVKPNTALCLLAIGASAVCLNTRSRQLLWPARLLALFAGVVGALTLSEYVFGSDLGIDRLLIPAPVDEDSPFPGRMTPQAAAAFVLASMALLLSAMARPRVKLAELFTIGVGLVAIFELAAHAYGAETLFSVAGRPQTGAAIPTDTSFLVFAISLVLARADSGLASQLACTGAGGYFLRLYLPLAIVVPLLVGLGVPLVMRAGIREVSAALALIAAVAIPAGISLLYLSARALNRADADRRRSTETLARLAAIVEGSEDAIYTRDLAERITSWNAGAERMYGYSAEEVLGKPLYEIVPPERWDDLHTVLERIQRGQSVGPVETVRVRKDGTRLPVLQTISVLRDDRGHQAGYSVLAHDITDRKRAENELRLSEERFRQLVEQASDGIFLADSSGRYIAVNPAGAAILGYEPEELIGKTIGHLLGPGDLPRLERDQEAIHRGETRRGEWLMRHKNGSWVPVEVTAKLLSDGRWQGFVRDISERRRAEAALADAHARERRLRAQLERVGKAAQEVTAAVAALPQTDLAAVMQTLVTQARAVTGARYAALGIGDDPERPFEPWVFSGMSEEEVRRIGRHPRPVGTLGAVAIDGQTLRLDNMSRFEGFRGFPPGHPPMESFLGVPIRFGGRSIGNLYLTGKEGGFTEEDQWVAELLATRVSAALETARLLRTESLARAWLKSVIDQMPEGVLLADEEGRLTWNNAALALGLDEGMLDRRGNPIRLRARTPAGRPVDWDALPIFAALERRAPVTGVELVLRTGAGREMWVIVNASPVPDGGAVAVFQDVSALKELQRLRDEWTAIVAHDLRQPVGAIRLAAELARRAHRGDMPAAELNALNRIGDSSRRLSRMIDDLLEASRIESRQLRLDKRHVDLAALSHELVEQSDFLPDDRPVRIVVEGPLPSVDADPVRIQQVLSNLLSNAVRYGTPGTEIRLQLRPLPGEVAVTVENQGPGLTEEELAHVFERRFRGKRAAEAAAGGLGLGLYIVKGLVEAHGGEITVESAPDGPTTFRFTLPASSAPEAEQHAPM